MNAYLEWLTAGLIFLWILGAHDARAAPVDPGNVRCESPTQNAFLPAPPFQDLHARTRFARSLPDRHDQLTAILRLLRRTWNAVMHNGDWR